MLKYPCNVSFWAHSSMVEQFPFKEAVEGSNPSGLTMAPSSSGLGQEVFSLLTWVRVPVGSPFIGESSNGRTAAFGAVYSRFES